MFLRRLIYFALAAALLFSTANVSAGSGSAFVDSPTSHAGSVLPAVQSQELLVGVAPWLDLKQLNLSDTFEVIFSEAMDTTSAANPLIVYPYLPGKAVWDKAKTHLSYQLDAAYQPGKTYYFFLDRDLKSASGKTFKLSQQWQAQVVFGPVMVGHTPRDAELNDLRPSVNVWFDREMDADSVKQAISITPAVPFDLTRESPLQYAIHPAKPLTPGQHYRFAVSVAAHDLKNVPLQQERYWDYLIPEPEASVQSMTHYQEIPGFSIRFNYMLDTKASGLPFKIDPSINGVWAWSSSQSADFTPDQPLDRTKRYTISITWPLMSSRGDPIVYKDPVVFTPPAPILRVLPAAGDTVDNSLARVAIQFDFALDKTSVEKAFEIAPAVKGHFVWDKDSVDYQFDEPLAVDTWYRVTLKPEVKDLAGKGVMLDPYTWSFHTGPYNAYTVAGDSLPFFGCGGINMQVVDANSRRALRFNASDSKDPVEFSLYQLDLQTFVKLYKQYHRMRDYYTYSLTDQDVIPTAGLERAAYWQAKVTNATNEALLPYDAPPGLYVLSADQGGKLKDQLFIALTANALEVKLAGSRLWTWTTKINGQGVKDLEVRLYTEDGAEAREGKTDASGIFETTVPAGAKPFLMVARGAGADVTVAGFEGSWFTWNSAWYGYSSDQSQAAAYKGYVYTDRPIYRPGQTVYYKAILRKDDDARYALPEANTPVKVVVRDGRGNELETQELKTSDFGTVNGSFELAEGAMLGDYSVTVSTSDAPDFSAGEVAFKVEEYRKPDFQVVFDADKDRYYGDSTPAFNGQVQYFFGKPVPNASLSVRLFRLESWGWWQSADSEPQNSGYTWYQADSSPEGKSFKADGQGKFKIDEPVAASNANPYDYTPGCTTSWSSSLQRCTWAVEISADDGSGQTVSAVKIFYVYNSPEKLSLDSGSWLKRPGEKFTISAVVKTVEGEKPVANRKLKLEFIYSSQSYDNKVVKSVDLITGANGVAKTDVQLDGAGGYEVRLSTAEDNFKNIIAHDWLYVASTADTWASDAWGEFHITAEQSHYQAYQTAKLAIVSDFSGPALLTFERGRVIHEQPVMLTAPLTVVETQVIPEYAPNVFVYVNAWRKQSTEFTSQDAGYAFTPLVASNSQLRLAQVELQVEGVYQPLNIAITPDRTLYAPRQEAKINLAVTDAKNNPVEAELSLALVDEAIYSLSGDLATPIFTAFYGKRDLTVSTFNSLAITRYGCADAGGRGGGGSPYTAANPRSDFPDTAVWLPSIRTGKDGKATASVTLPDNLTTWRIVVRAITKDTRVGEGTAKLTTQQAVIVQPVLPTALIAGDQAELTALVHNDASSALEMTVSIQASGLDLGASASQSLSFKAGEIKVVKWMAKALTVGETQVTISAQPKTSAGGSAPGDAVKLPLEVYPRAIPQIDTQVGDFKGELKTMLVAPESLLPSSTVEIKLSRSIAGNLLDGLEYLTGYPYGCVEQTMSRALPNAVVSRAFNKLGVEPQSKTGLEEKIRASVQRLYGFQHGDGGWGWWMDDVSTPYQTAWVIYGLALVKQAGYGVDEAVIRRGADYLTQQMGNAPLQNDSRQRAYALYSLAFAGLGDRDATLALVENSFNMDAFSQAALALALHHLGEKDAAGRMLDVLKMSAARDEGQVYWQGESEDGQYHYKTMSSTTRSTALALEALTLLDPESDLIPGAVRYLMNRRTSQGWGTTNETAYAVLALTDHLLAVKQSADEPLYQVKLNGQAVAQGKLDAKMPMTSLTLQAGQLKVGLNPLAITQTGAGQIYYTITSRMFFDLPSVDAAGPVFVQRAYLDPATNLPVKELKQGQIVRVRLSATFAKSVLSASYLIIEDRLPGGFEALNERLNTTTHYSGADTGDYYSETWTWQQYGYNQKEIRGDRVSFFVTELHGGVFYQVDYLARVTRAGSYTALPAQVYAMYDEQVWGRSASSQVTIK